MKKVLLLAAATLVTGFGLVHCAGSAPEQTAFTELQQGPRPPEPTPAPKPQPDPQPKPPAPGPTNTGDPPPPHP